MAALEQRVAALEPPSWPGTSSGFWSWVFSQVPSFLFFLLTLASMVFQAALSFVVFFMGNNTDYETDRWHRASAASRSITFAVLVLNLAGSGPVYWGTRVFLAIFLVAQCCELRTQILTIPVLLGLVAACELGSLAAAGWPIQLLPLVIGSVVSASLAADQFDQWKMLKAKKCSYICIWGCAAALFFHWWHTGAAVLTGTLWAGLAPMAFQLAARSAGIELELP